jgi:uncharacterized membrane protein YsdA (DUF1294 family)
MFLAVAICLYGIAVNLAAYWLFGTDKRRAIAQEQRIPEATLLMAALLGGWPGAKAGQRRYRHKTRKQPFRSILDLIGLAQLAGLVLLFTPAGGVLTGVALRADAALVGVGTSLRAGMGAMTQGEPAPEERPMPRRFGPGSSKDRLVP